MTILLDRRLALLAAAPARPLLGQGLRQTRVTVPMNGGPPRRHPVDELPTVAEHDVRTLRALDRVERPRGARRRVRMQHHAPVACDEVSHGRSHAP